ncbi:hypothetical protein CHS0354_016709 [Potamilus streckersoni]|uniref:Uncharacterized protein n=1 Tax=Potamilus streckersoni TaxID=2493646 RepID=A0AAE0TIH2_9BIVA|nr:hypothetical protein CHS0354_016709 [Potamilus streckersoni]
MPYSEPAVIYIYSTLKVLIDKILPNQNAALQRKICYLKCIVVTPRGQIFRRLAQISKHRDLNLQTPKDKQASGTLICRHRRVRSLGALLRSASIRDLNLQPPKDQQASGTLICRHRGIRSLGALLRSASIRDLNLQTPKDQQASGTLIYRHRGVRSLGALLRSASIRDRNLQTPRDKQASGTLIYRHRGVRSLGALLRSASIRDLNLQTPKGQIFRRLTQVSFDLDLQTACDGRSWFMLLHILRWLIEIYIPAFLLQTLAENINRANFKSGKTNITKESIPRAE